MGFNITNRLIITALIGLIFFGSGCFKRGNKTPGPPSSFTSLNPSGGGSSTPLAPLPPVSILIPMTNPYTANLPALTVHGSCSSGAIIYLSGNSNQNTQCFNNTFSLNIPAGTQTGILNYSLTQKSIYSLASPAVTFQWVRDTSLPLNPIITSPTNPHHSNQNNLTITGTCSAGLTVNLSETEGGSSQTQTCSSEGSFQFELEKTSDEEFLFSLTQSTTQNVSSGVTLFSWSRDTVAPSTPQLSAPTSNPFASAGTSVTIAGSCEPNTSVQLTGATSGSMVCSNGTFNFTSNKSSDGTYNYSLSQTDLAGNTSGSTSFVWLRNSTTPPVPTVTNHASPFHGNQSTLILSGACISGNTVHLLDLSTNSNFTSNCQTNNTYSQSVNKSSDGSYSFQLHQTNSGGVSSNLVSFQWILDTIAPSLPVVTNPTQNPYTSDLDFITISGSCESGATVQVSGASNLNLNCANGSFGFTATKTQVQAYQFLIKQTDLASNQSSVTSLQWNKTSPLVNPDPITNLSPENNPLHTNTNSVTLTGNCVTGNTIEYSGDETGTVTCTSGTFSVVLNRNTDGTTAVSLIQKNPANLSSPPVSFSWVRDTVVPSAPEINNPLTTPFYSNGNSFSLSGSCENQSNVVVTGSGGFQTTTNCAGNVFAFSIPQSADGTYQYSVTQTDLAGNLSTSSTSIIWNRDTVHPEMPMISNPTTNPHHFYGNDLVISGSCVASENTVQLSGSGINVNQTCSSLGSFSFTVSKNTDGAFDFQLSQSDPAGNASDPLTFTWIRDINDVPLAAPLIVAPIENPILTNGNSINLQVTCDDAIGPLKAVVTVAGSGSSPLLQPCTSSPVTFSLNRNSDGNHDFQISQSNPNSTLTSIASENTLFTWIRDTVPPNAPTLSTPTINPFISPNNMTLNGNCEINATVTLAGSVTASEVSGGSLTQTCTNGFFSYLITKTTDGSYPLTLTQTDQAQNTSTITSIEWIRFNGSVDTPAITAPNTPTLVNNQNQLVLSGTCESGNSVTLFGNVTSTEVLNPAGSLTQTCSSGTFQYIVNKQVDGNFDLQVKQTKYGYDSGFAMVSWTRDTVIPLLTMVSAPSSVHLQSTSTFQFSSNDSSATFQCKLDGGSFTSCSSPVNLNNLQNGNHTYQIIATDPAGNTSTTLNHSWHYAGYNTIALYHLNSTNPLTDSSLFTSNAGFNNHLTMATAAATPAPDVTGALPNTSPQSRAFTATRTWYSVPHNNSLNLPSTKLSVEGRVKFVAVPSSNNAYYTLVSKSDGNTGWEVRLRRQNSTSYFLDFWVSVNGAAFAKVNSNPIYPLPTNSWQYFAVTFDQGTVKFYFGAGASNLIGTQTIGTPGSASITSSLAPLRIAGNSLTPSTTSLRLNGSLDEIRISQIVRLPTSTTLEFNAD